MTTESKRYRARSPKRPKSGSRNVIKSDKQTYIQINIALNLLLFINVYIGGLLSQRTTILTIIGLVPFRAHICIICWCMREFFSAINPTDSCAYDGLLQWLVRVWGEKIWRIQCWALVRLRRSRSSARLIISLCTPLLKEHKHWFESQEEILCIDHKIVCTLAHNEPETRLQSQATAKILECPLYFSAFLHLISTESRECIVNLPYTTLTNAVILRCVLYAHYTAITAISGCVLCVMRIRHTMSNHSIREHHIW